MTTFKPYENESDSQDVGGVIFENRVDRISVYGSAALTKDKEGLKIALALKEMIDTVVTHLQSEHLPDKITLAPTDEVKNPFDE